MIYNGRMRNLSFALLFALAAAAQAPSIEQSLSLKSVASPKISPDGKRVAYEVQEADWKENAFKTDIHVVRSEEHTSELQSRQYLECRLLLEKKKHDTT